MKPSMISFSRLLCLDTCPKYCSFRDFTWPIKALPCPTLCKLQETGVQKRKFSAPKWLWWL